MPIPTPAELGRAGEEAAARHYTSKGDRILVRNMSCPHGEIDLIVEAADGTVVFVEVKTRSTPSFGGIEAISPRKSSMIRRTVAVWLAEYPGHSVRFDAVLVAPHAGHWSVECWEDIDRGAR
ncbi:YraN family protein [Corynebacterium sp. CCM 9203]|uniref:YraN family protein n=1 Tax=Corynebacterium sp. CCM 9203 TaxID=3057615 RepID=UPI003525EE8B